MPRKTETKTAATPLAKFLSEIKAKEVLTIRQLALEIKLPPSVVGEWLRGATPSSTSMIHLKRFCSSRSVSLAMALTGEQDTLQSGQYSPEKLNTDLNILSGFLEESIFNGVCRIQVTRLVPHPKKPETKE